MEEEKLLTKFFLKIMPSIGFDEDINLPGVRSQFISLENKGEKIRFRIANKAHYRGQHWIPDEDLPIDCPRVNNDEYCEYCEKFENGELPPGVEVDEKGKIVKGRNWYKPSIQFLYPILNRDTGESQIFQTTLMVHMDIREAAKAGIDVYKSDWQVTRNEGSPAKYYSTVRLDPIPLTKEDKVALEQAKKIEFETIFKEGFKTSSMEPPVEGEPEEEQKEEQKEEPKEEPAKGTEEVSPSDVPF